MTKRRHLVPGHVRAFAVFLVAAPLCAVGCATIPTPTQGRADIWCEHKPDGSPPLMRADLKSRNSPDDVGLVCTLAAEYRLIEEWDAAIQLIETSQRKWPNEHCLLVQRTWLELKRGHLEDASHLLREAENLGPVTPEVHVLAGAIALKKKEHEEAERAYNAAISLAPKHVGANLGLAALAERRGGYQRSHQLHLALLDGQPENWRVRASLGDLYHTGFCNWKAALDHYRYALRLRPGDPSLMLAVSGAATNAGRTQLALNQAQTKALFA